MDKEMDRNKPQQLLPLCAELSDRNGESRLELRGDREGDGGAGSAH